MSQKTFFKKNFTFLIITSVIIIIILAFSLSYILKNKNSDKLPNQGNYSIIYNPGNSTYHPQNYTPSNYNFTQPPFPNINAQILQEILQKSPEISKLPADAKIIIEFHDNNKQYCGYIFFIGGQGKVYPYANQNYDLWFTLNIYKISELQNSANVCATLRSLVQNGYAWQVYQTSNPFTLLKYLGIKSCVM